MRTSLRTLLGLGAALVLAGSVGTASAAPAAGWTAGNGTTADGGVVRLDSTNGPTSYENENLAVQIADSQELSFEYKLSDGATCAGGAPRVFVQLEDGVPADNTWDGEAGQCGTATAEAGWYLVTHTFSGVEAGPAGHVGIVNDSGTPSVIEVRNLVIAGHTIALTSPESASDCKNGGWAAGDYKNQGDCVSSFARAKNGK